MIKSDKIKEIYTTITKTKLLKIWFRDNIPNILHEIISEVKFWNMNSSNCSIIKELKTKKYQMRARDAKACELTSATQNWLDNLNVTLRSRQLTVDEYELPIPYPIWAPFFECGHFFRLSMEIWIWQARPKWSWDSPASFASCWVYSHKPCALSHVVLLRL